MGEEGCERPIDDAGGAVRVDRPASEPAGGVSDEDAAIACPVCGGGLVDVRGKLQCVRCHRIVESCCEGGRG